MMKKNLYFITALCALSITQYNWASPILSHDKVANWLSNCNEQIDISIDPQPNHTIDLDGQSDTAAISEQSNEIYTTFADWLQRPCCIPIADLFNQQNISKQSNRINFNNAFYNHIMNMNSHQMNTSLINMIHFANTHILASFFNHFFTEKITRQINNHLASQDKTQRLQDKFSIYEDIYMQWNNILISLHGNSQNTFEDTAQKICQFFHNTKQKISTLLQYNVDQYKNNHIIQLQDTNIYIHVTENSSSLLKLAQLVKQTATFHAHTVKQKDFHYRHIICEIFDPQICNIKTQTNRNHISIIFKHYKHLTNNENNISPADFFDPLSHDKIFFMPHDLYISFLETLIMFLHFVTKSHTHLHICDTTSQRIQQVLEQSWYNSQSEYYNQTYIPYTNTINPHIYISRQQKSINELKTMALFASLIIHNEATNKRGYFLEKYVKCNAAFRDICPIKDLDPRNVLKIMLESEVFNFAITAFGINNISKFITPNSFNMDQLKLLNGISI